MTLKWHAGGDGHLFLENDTNEIWRQISGDWHYPITSFAPRWISRHIARASLCEADDAMYVHMIVPNKESALLEMAGYARDGQVIAQDRSPIVQTLAMPFKFKERIFYDRAVLANGDLFHRTDSHWNHEGALRYLRRALTKWGMGHLSLFLDDLILGWEEFEHQGDLGLHASLPREAARRPILRRPPSILYEGTVINEGYFRHYRNDHAPIPGKALIHHDSTAHWLFDILASLFSETLFVHVPDFDPSFSRAYQASYVFFLQMQRFTVRLHSNEGDLPSYIDGKESEKGCEPLFMDYAVRHLV